MTDFGGHRLSLLASTTAKIVRGSLGFHAELLGGAYRTSGASVGTRLARAFLVNAFLYEIAGSIALLTNTLNLVSSQMKPSLLS